jgi:methanogenic corrinoid protein MtbC1
MSKNAEGRAEPRHPIRVVAERTGLTPDVLRVWQRRYGVVRPDRSESGQRLYTDEEVERLRLMALAVEGGRSVSQVAALPTESLERLVLEDEEARAAQPGRGAAERGILEDALAAVHGLDGEGLEQTLRRALVVKSVARFLEDIASPLFEEIGHRWGRGELTAAHEHMASAVMRRVLDWVIQACEAGEGAPRMVVGTLSSEQHEIGALFVAATAASEGWSVTYLGANLPAAEIAAAAEQAGASAVAISVVYVEDAKSVGRQMEALRAALPERIDLLAGGAGWLGLNGKRSAPARTIRRLSDLRGYLSRPLALAARPRRAR